MLTAGGGQASDAPAVAASAWTGLVSATVWLGAVILAVVLIALWYVRKEIPRWLDNAAGSIR